MRRTLPLYLLILFSMAAFLPLRAQVLSTDNYTPTLIFDIVSIHPSGPAERSLRVGIKSDPHSSRFEVTNFTMKSILQIAYGFDKPVAGGPAWMDTTFYNLQARSDEAADARLAKLTVDQVRLEKQHALQVMLAERLGLKTHMETRESSIYNLVVAKSGVKMKVVPPAPDNSPTPLAVDVQAHGGRLGLEFVVTNAPARAICGLLSSQLRAPVLDKTGLTAAYNFTLQVGGEWSANDPDGWPSVYTAVQEQLGLKLEAVKAPVPNVIIDRITQPTEN